jgi:hypothetical protein
MATQKFTHLSSKSFIKALGTLTMNGSIGNAHVIDYPFDKAMLVINDADLTGALTVTVVGSTVAAGTSGFTTIKTVVFSAALANMEMSVEVDSEEVSYAQDQAGVVFLSTVFRLTGTNSDTLDAAVQVLGFHQYSDLTPTGTGVTA